MSKRNWKLISGKFDEDTFIAESDDDFVLIRDCRVEYEGETMKVVELKHKIYDLTDKKQIAEIGYKK